MQDGQLAKAILCSVITTLFVIGVLGHAFSDQLVAYLDERRSIVVTEEVSGPPATVTPITESIVDVIERVNPAVVSVVVTKDVPTYERYYEELGPFGLFGNDLLVPRIRENGTEEREIGGGSGFIVSPDGLIVTNRHVVDDLEARYSVLLTDGSVYETTVVARDPQLDIAVLELVSAPDTELSFLTFGDSESLRLGESVVAIGNALAEFRNSVSVGVISGLARSITASDGMGMVEQLDQVIQTDAAINPGNSGGPLVNGRGEVIGVNVATSRGADNISFALPAHVVEQVVTSVQTHGEIIRPFIGVRYTMITPQLQDRYNLGSDYGALVTGGTTVETAAVLPDSPAAEAGITEGTIILSIDGEELRETDLASVLRSKAVGETISLDILQNDERRTISLTLTRAPS